MKTSMRIVLASLTAGGLALLAWSAAVAQRPPRTEPVRPDTPRLAPGLDQPSRFNDPRFHDPRFHDPSGPPRSGANPQGPPTPPVAVPGGPRRPAYNPNQQGTVRPWPQTGAPLDILSPAQRYRTPQEDSSSHPAGASQPMKMVQRVRQDIVYVMVPLTREERRRQQELAEAVAALNDEQDSEDQEQARSKIKNLLQESFDEDMEKRRGQLDELGMKVKQLQASFDKRTEAREEIIQHRLRGLELEAEGLNFPGPPTNRSAEAIVPAPRVPGSPGPGVSLPGTSHVPLSDPTVPRPAPENTPIERPRVGP